MIDLTARAALKLDEIRAHRNRMESALRIAVLGGDCAGLKYFIGLDDFRGHDDYLVKSQDHLLYVDSQSAPYLWGSQVDWMEVEGEGGFVLFNPNKGRSQGGCGSNGNGCMTKGDGKTCLNKKKKEGGCASGGCSCGAKAVSAEPMYQIALVGA